jgi:hypothetical protein
MNGQRKHEEKKKTEQDGTHRGGTHRRSVLRRKRGSSRVVFYRTTAQQQAHDRQRSRRAVQGYSRGDPLYGRTVHDGAV